MPNYTIPHIAGSKELFRYVRLEQPKFIDLQFRASHSTQLQELMNKPAADQKRWAESFIQSSDARGDESELTFDYFSHLNIGRLPALGLPGKESVRDLKAFAQLHASKNDLYGLDRDNVLKTVLALKILKREKEADKAAQVLHFIERFPKLHESDRLAMHAPAILNKTPIAASRKPSETIAETEQASYGPQAQLGELLQNLHSLWLVRNQRLRDKTIEFNRASKQLLSRQIDLVDQQQHKRLLAGERIARIAALQREFTEFNSKRRVQDVLDLSPQELATYLPQKTEADIVGLQTMVKAQMQQHGVTTTRFCEAYEKIVNLIQSQPEPELKTEIAEAIKFRNCFVEHPVLHFEDTIRILGKANLIKVEEKLIEYRPGEIAYVENILAGEIRKREVKNTRYFEQNSETISEESTDISDETSASTKQELSSQVDMEIRSRLNADINSSVSGSGGGKIGIIDVTGSASVGANLSTGVDTSLATKNSSEFSREIVNKAIERTRKSVIEKRANKTYSLFETINSHEINNTVGDIIKSRNEIYCFLDKHVCITETQYDERLFLLANIMLPGKNLLCEKHAKHQLSSEETGAKPVFDLSPGDIQPHNYKQLTGKYKGANIQPPPPAIMTIGKTYKTDTSNANVEQQEMNVEKVAEVLAPFFERYKRFLLTDNIKIPEGYQVAEVTVTVNHGSNGISIPAELPLKLAGSFLSAGMTFVSAAASGIVGPAIFVPLSVWQFLYGASPMLHYNNDSSNVTVCVGNESFDSAYYFFDAEFLVQELMALLTNFASMSPDLLEQIRIKANELTAQLATGANGMADEVKSAIEDSINNLVNNIQNVLNSLSISVTGSLRNGLKAAPTFDFNALTNSIASFTTMVDSMKELFNPLTGFINSVIAILQEGMQSLINDFLDLLAQNAENSRNLHFYNSAGMKGDLPVSFNAISIHPGITLNLTACLIRTDEALDRWRLETFQSLYQSHLQLLAEYESKMYLVSEADKLATSSGNLRIEERTAVKELILHALNNLHAENGNEYTLENMNLFENTIDWENMSYKLYQYGPALKYVKLEKHGIYAGVDDRRRAFLKSLWAQVLIPVQGNKQSVGLISSYFDHGRADFDAAFKHEEIAAIYRDLVLGGETMTEIISTSPPRVEVIPTDLMVIVEESPKNNDTLCSS